MAMPTCKLNGCRLVLKKEGRESVEAILSEDGLRVLRKPGTVKFFVHQCYFCGKEWLTRNHFDFQENDMVVPTATHRIHIKNRLAKLADYGSREAWDWMQAILAAERAENVSMIQWEDLEQKIAQWESSLLPTQPVNRGLIFEEAIQVRRDRSEQQRFVIATLESAKTDEEWLAIAAFGLSSLARDPDLLLEVLLRKAFKIGFQHGADQEESLKIAATSAVAAARKLGMSLNWERRS